MFDAAWRTEMWHPLTVHFPVALLLGATFCSFVSFFLGDSARKYWTNTATGMLLAGCLGAWVAIYTGDLADGIVARQICDPTVLKDHEIAAFRMTYLFSAATVLSIVVLTRLIPTSRKHILHYVMFLLMVTGSGFLVYAGHLGARLVYEQGAGVNKPSADCAGFE